MSLRILRYIIISTFMSKILSINVLPSKSVSGLHGYDFFRAIGSPKYVSAPMVDQSSLPWRLLVKKHKTDLAFSQMMHARNFMNDKKYREDCIDWEDYTHTSGNPDLELQARRADFPLIVQLAGDDPNVLVNAGKYVENSPNVVAIDLNLGCPQKIAKRGNYGAYLLPDTDLIQRLLTSMVKELKVPITAKIRRLATDEETLHLCRVIESCGVSLLTVHGRTVENAKLYTSQADWDIIRKVKETVAIPVIANGGISCREDALQCLEYTGADGVMSSEALLENPKLFCEEGDLDFRTNYVRCQLSTATEFLQLVESHALPRALSQVVRGHLFKFLFRFVDAEKNADFRQLLAEGKYEDMKSIVRRLEERLASVDFDTKAAEEQGWLNNRTWYMRHRDDKAFSRILSPRRSRAPKDFGKTAEDIAREREERLDALRKRLAERKGSSLATQ